MIYSKKGLPVFHRDARQPRTSFAAQFTCVSLKVATGMAVSTYLLTAILAWSQLVPGSLDVHWNEGASDCSATPQDSLQAHKYEPQTFILRQSPCASFEANFVYLLIGSDKALLIDTGAVADPQAMPLAKMISELLPEKNRQKASTPGGAYPQASGSSRGRPSVCVASIGPGCAIRFGGAPSILRFY